MADDIREELDDDEISLVDLAAVLWRQKRLIIGVTVVAAVLSVAYALLQPNKYTATSTLLPIGDFSSTMAAQYAGLASLAGVNLPNSAAASDPSVKIQAILNSRAMAEKLVDRLDLVPKLLKHPEKIKDMTPRTAAILTFQKDVFSVSSDPKTFLIKVSAKTKNPELSRDIVNTSLELLQADLNQRVLTASGKTVAFLEEQVAQQERKVRELESKVTDYQKKNRLVVPQSQTQASFDLYKSLIQQKIALEIEISRLGNALSPDNPKLVTARTQLQAVEKQIANIEKTGGGVNVPMGEAPRAMMDYAALASELEFARKMYASLLTNLENTRLQAANERLFVEIIDYAVAPEKKSEPSRAMICIIGTLIGGFLSVLFAFFKESLDKLKADPEVRAKFASSRKNMVA